MTSPRGQPLGVAVVGVGYWGPNLVRNFRAYEGTKLLWVCDLDESRARRVVSDHTSIRVSKDLETILEDPEVDALAIVTPAGTHTELAMRSLAAGKHLLVEKPLADSVDAAEELVNTAEAQGLVLMTDHTFCYTAAVRKMRELVRSGELGDFRYFDSVRVNLGLVQSEIDVFWDLAPHDLSILDFILPDDCTPVAVAAQASDPIGVGHACIGYLSLTLSNGAIAHAHLNWLSPTKIRMTIVGGSKKMILWDDLHPSQRLSIFDTGVELDGHLNDQERRRALVSYRVGDMVVPALQEVEALSLVVREFVSSIWEGRPPMTDGRAGLRVVQMLEAINQSLASGGVSVPLPPRG